MLRKALNTLVFLMAVSVLMPAGAQANWFFGERVKGTWLREVVDPPTGSQMLVSMGRDGSFTTAASSGAFNTGPTSFGTLLLSPGVGTWTRSGPNSISLTQLQYLYSEETGDLIIITRMTGEIVFDEPEPRHGRFTAASAEFAVEGFLGNPPGTPPSNAAIVPGMGAPFGVFTNSFHRAP
jgi:hypothetical protein